MAVHLKRRDGFGPGYTQITTTADETGIELAVLEIDEPWEEVTAAETAFLLMNGDVEIAAGDEKVRCTRASLFDEAPSAVHVPKGTSIRIVPAGAAELTVYRIDNEDTFPVEIYRPDDVRNDLRGKGGLKDAAYRFVRTIFDDQNSHRNARMVLGEVVNMPGRWSSYPPHHHAQPEIYHYRFTEPQGYGHAELGEEVLKVRHFDTVKILDLNDHSQCAAPGYGMYYAWVIRHLEGDRYSVPEFTEEHRWLMERDAKHWWPSDT